MYLQIKNIKKKNNLALETSETTFKGKIYSGMILSLLKEKKKSEKM